MLTQRFPSTRKRKSRERDENKREYMYGKRSVWTTCRFFDIILIVLLLPQAKTRLCVCFSMLRQPLFSQIPRQKIEMKRNIKYPNLGQGEENPCHRGPCFLGEIGKSSPTQSCSLFFFFPPFLAAAQTNINFPHATTKMEKKKKKKIRFRHIPDIFHFMQILFCGKTLTSS